MFLLWNTVHSLKQRIFFLALCATALHSSSTADLGTRSSGKYRALDSINTTEDATTNGRILGP
eukprot:COSAG03_NODE_13730_length_491_cov_0.793367_1_plen_62_part_01